MNNKNDRKAILTGHIGNLLEREAEETTTQQVKECKHKDYCTSTQFSMKCIFGINNCNIKKFYDRYGEDYNLQGVGIR